MSSGVGAAYTFTFDGSQPLGQQWVQEAKLTADDAGEGDEFGWSVSLDGERALVGAATADAAYVFTFDAASWSQQAKLVAGERSHAGFGSAVSLSEDRALVGAEWDDAAYVFAFDGSQPPGQQWVHEAKLAADDTAPGDQFGNSVSLFGDRALVGAEVADGGGAAYTFTFDGSQPQGQQWVQEAKLAAGYTLHKDYFGSSVSLLGALALIGARHDVNNNSVTGSAYLFTLEGTQWVQEAKITAVDTENSSFGNSVSLSGARALIGANTSYYVSGPYSGGSAYIFDLGVPLAAEAGPDQTVVAGQTVTLDGSASTGAETFAWTLDGAPFASTVQPSFCAAAPGSYTATLTVTNADGSDTDAVAVTAVSATAALSALVADVAATPGPDRDQKRALVAELKKAQRALDRGLSPAPFLDAFRSQVQALQSGGVLTAVAADALRASADAVADATASPCSPAVAASSAALGFGLAAYPNPSAGRVTVAFSVAAAGPVRLSVVDALGREVAVLVEGAVEAGRHQVALDAEALPAGVYLVRLSTAGGRLETQRITRL